MAKPKGTLSPAQFEILQAIWAIGPPGATRMQIWERIAAGRKVVRTTVVNLVDRLEARGWLARSEQDGQLLFWPTASQEEVAATMAAEFVDNFFGGSMSSMIMSLVGRNKLQRDEIEQLRAIYQQAVSQKKDAPHESTDDAAKPTRRPKR